MQFIFIFHSILTTRDETPDHNTRGMTIQMTPMDSSTTPRTLSEQLSKSGQACGDDEEMWATTTTKN